MGQSNPFEEFTISRRPQPEHQQAPVVQRIRIRYAKRGPMRFTSHRDFARAFERAILRAKLPIGYSSGFSPHPKISYASAAPTTVASEAEYLEIGLRERMEPAEVGRALDAALSPGLDIIEAVQAGGGGLPERIDASRWRLELTGVEPDTLRSAVATFLAAAEITVERLTKQGRRSMDTRGPVVAMVVIESPTSVASGRSGAESAVKWPESGGAAAPSGVSVVPCAILDLVVRQATPTVRPDDVLSGLRVVAGLEPPVPPRATRLAQGTLTAHADIVDPLAADRDTAVSGTSSP